MKLLKPRIRPYDLLTILGIVVLLVWVPVYWANGTEPQSPPDGHRFTPPVAHYGDRIKYELIVQQEDTIVSTGPVLTVEYREPEPGAGPEGAVLVEERSFPALHVDLGPVTLVQDESRMVRFVDADGAFLEVRYSKHFIKRDRSSLSFMPELGQEGDTMVTYTNTSQRIDPAAFTPFVRMHPIVYKPTSTLEAITDFFRTEGTAQTNESGEPTAHVADRMPSGDEQQTAPFAATHAGRVLYANMVQETRGSSAKVPWLDENEFTFGFRSAHLPLFWNGEEPAYVATRHWDWWAEDIPLQAGTHWTYLGEEEKPVLSLDLVPSSVTSGDTSSSVDGYTFLFPHTRDRAVQLPTFQDEEPFVGDISLARLERDLLGPDAPESIQARIGQDARFAGMKWEATHEAVRLLVAVASDQNISVAYLQYGEETVIKDACGSNVVLGNRTLEPECDEYPHGIFIKSLEDSIRSPSQVVQVLRDKLNDPRDPGFVEHGGFGFLLRTNVTSELGNSPQGIATFSGGYTNPWGETVFVIHETEDSLAMTSGSYDHDPVGYEETNRVQGTEGLGSALALQHASASAAPTVFSPYGPEPIYGGFLLVIIGMLVRFLYALKAGTLLPVVAPLYAKITKDKALQNHHREAIADLVDKEPCITLAEVARSVGLSRTGSFHHLETLVHNHLLHVVVVARSRYYFPASAADPTDRLRQAVTRRASWRLLLETVESHPGISLHRLSERLDGSKPRVSRIGSRLEALGLVRKQRHGRNVRFYPITVTRSKIEPRTQRQKETVQG